MESPFKSNVDILVRELQRYSGNMQVRPFIRIKHNDYVPVEKAYNVLCGHKIKLICKTLRKKVYVRSAVTTNSIYFTINKVRFRVSDHPPGKSTDEVDHFLNIKWDTCVIQMLSSIDLLSLNIK